MNPYDNHPYNNTVIEVLDLDHGRKVTDWWRSQGIATTLLGSNNKKADHNNRFYGLINGIFTMYQERQFKPEVVVIQLPTTKTNVEPKPGMFLQALRKDVYGIDIEEGEYLKILEFGSYNICIDKRGFRWDWAGPERFNQYFKLMPEGFNPWEKGFTLPEKWCIFCTPDNAEVLRNWRSIKCEASKLHDKYLHSSFGGSVGYSGSNPFKGYEVITFEQFRQHVLGEITEVVQNTPLTPPIKPFTEIFCDSSPAPTTEKIPETNEVTLRPVIKQKPNTTITLYKTSPEINIHTPNFAKKVIAKTVIHNFILNI